MRKFTIYNLQFTIKFIFLLFTFYILHFTFLVSPAYAQVKIEDKFDFSGKEFSSLGSITTKLVPLIFSLATAIVIIYFLWGAFNYLKSGGSKEELQKAREMIIHSIFGFLILMSAFFMLQFLLDRLFGIQGFFGFI